MTRRALFLDRDGVVNEERGYVHRREDFVFLDGVFEACRAAARLGYLLVVASNQSGIGRGLYSEAAYRRLTDWMLARFRAERVEIAAVYFDPTHPTEGRGPYRRESLSRKPAPGMLLKARDELGLDLARSALVGDSERDIQAGQAAGVGRLIRLARPGTASGAALVCASLREAVGWLATEDAR